MHVILNHRSMIPIYEQIVGHIKTAVISRELQPGEGLPSVRALAAELKISALTVKKAYDSLEKEGLVVTVHGKGSFVAEADTGMVEEERRLDAENKLSRAVDAVRAAGLSDDEIRSLLEIILEG